MSEDNSRLEGDLDLSGDSATTKQRFPQISLGQRSFPKWAAGVAIGLLAVVVVYIALIVSVSGQLPAKTTVSGVVLNGLAPAQAKAKLTKALDARAGKPITVQVNGKTVKIEAATAGLSADPNETIDSLAGLGTVTNSASLTDAILLRLRFREALANGSIKDNVEL